MIQEAVLFFLAVLAGFALILITDIADPSGLIADILIAVGVIAVVVFSVALLFLAFRSLFRKWRK